MRVLRMIRAPVANLVRVLLAVAVQRPVGQTAAGVADDAAVAGPRFVAIQVDGRLFDVLALAVQIDHLLGHEMVHGVDAQPLAPNVAQTDRRRHPLHHRVSLVLDGQ